MLAFRFPISLRIGTTSRVRRTIAILVPTILIGLVILVVCFIPAAPVDVPGASAADRELSLDRMYARRGQYGDMFGFVTCMFTGISIVLLVYNIFLLKQQLQAESDRADAEKLESSSRAEAAKLESDRMEDERQYFRFLDIHRTFENSAHGNIAHLADFVIKFKAALSPPIFDSAVTSQADFVKVSRDTFVNLYNSQSHYEIASPYFVSCRNIARCITKNKDSDQRKFFTDAFASMLRPAEHELIFYMAMLSGEALMQHLMVYLNDSIGLPLRANAR